MTYQCWYYATECPLDGTCSPRAFRTAKCTGRSEAAVRARLRKHLMNSGLHRKSFEDATELAKQAKIEMQQWLSEDIAAWDAEQPSKRQKTRHGDEPKGGTLLTNEDVKEVVRAAIAAHKRGDNDSAETSQSGEWDDVRVTDPTSNDASNPPPPEGGVTLSQAQTKIIVDYLTATETGCIAAHQLLKQAAHVFDEQAKEIRDIIHNV